MWVWRYADCSLSPKGRQNDVVHLVCPHCAAVSRLAAARLHDQPVCGKCARALFTAHPVDVNAATFLKYRQRNDIPLLVDFWAPRCRTLQDDGARLRTSRPAA